MHHPVPRPMAGGPGPPCIFTSRQGTELVAPWLGVRSAGPRPVTFDPGSYDVTAGCYVMIK